MVERPFKPFFLAGARGGHIQSATALTEMFIESQKVTAVVLEYDTEILSPGLGPDRFAVTDLFETALYPGAAAEANGGAVCSPRTLTRVYAHDAPEKTDSPTGLGRYVVLELSPDDGAAPTLYLVGYHRNCRGHMKDVRIMVEQVGALVSGSGAAIPPGDMVFTTKTVNAVTDDFLEGEFEGLKYNLFIPKNYDGNKSYPLVHFIVDSWGVGPDCKVTLAQGLGGTVWAFPQEQAKRECFVLSPQFPGPTIVEDDYSVADALETAKRLIDHVVGAYRIDRSRIYHTGQSMGYLAGCELNIRYPDLFAGCLFVSGFWNPETMTALKDKNIWFLVSAGDHARQKMDAAIANLEAGGADVARYAWDAAEGVGAIDEKVRDACKEWHRIRYTVFDKGSAEAATYPYGDHRATWLFCYQVEALREWLFSTRKDA